MELDRQSRLFCFRCICSRYKWRSNTPNFILSDVIQIATNTNGPISLVLSRNCCGLTTSFSGTSDVDIVVEDLTIEFAIGSYGDDDLKYASTWESAMNLVGSADLESLYSLHSNYVMHIEALDLFIEGRVLAYENVSKGIDGSGMAFPYYSDLFAHVRGSGPTFGETNSLIETLQVAETPIWAIDKSNNTNNVHIVNDGGASALSNQDNIFEGVAISRPDSGEGLYNMLDNVNDVANENISGSFVMFCRVPDDFNIETELDLIPLWNWRYDVRSHFASALKSVSARNYRMLIAVMSYDLALNSYTTELISEAELLTWASYYGFYGQFSYVRGSGMGDTELGRAENGRPFDDYLNGTAALLELNTAGGESGYRLKNNGSSDLYGTLGSNAVDLSKNESSGANGASAAHSFTSGRNTVADGFNTTAIGAYNTNDEGANAANFSLTNRAFVIGNGDGSERSDAFTVLFDGTTTVAGELNINSDMRLKANIISLGTTLAKLLKLDGKSYTMKRDEQQKTKIGLLAQDIQKVYPELVSEHNGLLSVNYQGLVPVLINAVKEQQKKINENTALIKMLMEKNKN